MGKVETFPEEIGATEAAGPTEESRTARSFSDSETIEEQFAIRTLKAEAAASSGSSAKRTTLSCCTAETQEALASLMLAKRAGTGSESSLMAELEEKLATESMAEVAAELATEDSNRST